MKSLKLIFILSIVNLYTSIFDIRMECKPLSQLDGTTLFGGKRLSEHYIDAETNNYKDHAIGNGYNYVFKTTWNQQPAVLKLLRIPLDDQEGLEFQFYQLGKEVYLQKFFNLPFINNNEQFVAKIFDCYYKIDYHTIGDQPKTLKVFMFQESLDKDLIKAEYFLGTIQLKQRYYKRMFELIAKVHEKKIVHNDIKPANLMFKGDEIFLIDFGIADPINSIAFMSTLCYDYPNKNPNDRQSFYLKPQNDVYSTAVTIAVLESSYEKICKNYRNKVCNYQSRVRLNCLDNVRQIIFEVMKKVFNTEKKVVDNLDECQNYGCVINFCLQDQFSKIPSAIEVIRAFERIDKSLNQQVFSSALDQFVSSQHLSSQAAMQSVKDLVRLSTNKPNDFKKGNFSKKFI